MEWKHEDRNPSRDLSAWVSNYNDSHVDLINKVKNTQVISVIYLFIFFTQTKSFSWYGSCNNLLYGNVLTHYEGIEIVV